MGRVVGLFWSWLPVLVWMAVILSLSSRSDLRSVAPPQVSESQGAFFAVSKAVHVAEYSILSLLVLRALLLPCGGVGLALGPAAIVAVLASGIFGGLDELRQSFVPDRSPRFLDIALDTASALAATLLAAGLLKLRAARTPRLAVAPSQPRAGEGVGR